MGMHIQIYTHEMTAMRKHRSCMLQDFMLSTHRCLDIVYADGNGRGFSVGRSGQKSHLFHVSIGPKWFHMCFTCHVSIKGNVSFSVPATECVK